MTNWTERQRSSYTQDTIYRHTLIFALKKIEWMWKWTLVCGSFLRLIRLWVKKMCDWILQVEQHNWQIQQSFAEYMDGAFSNMQCSIEQHGMRHHHMLNNYSEAIGKYCRSRKHNCPPDVMYLKQIGAFFFCLVDQCFPKSGSEKVFFVSFHIMFPRSSESSQQLIVQIKQ